MISVSDNSVNSILVEPKTIIDTAERDRYGRPVDYKIVNNKIRRAVSDGVKSISLTGIMLSLIHI